MVGDLFDDKAKQEIIDKVNSRPTFEFKEDDSEGKEVYTIYGNKGEGKTTLALSFPGTIAVLCFDHKSALVKRNMYQGDERIKVFDAVEYLSEDSTSINETSDLTYEYILFLLREIETKVKPDWIVVDGLEILIKIGEGVMRHRHKLKPFQGIANLSVWKERRLVIRNIHKECIDVVKKGVIYTTYTKEKEIIKEGTTESKSTVPNWIDIVMYETDCVLYAYSVKEGDRMKFYTDVISNKLLKPTTGSKIDVTAPKRLMDYD